MYEIDRPLARGGMGEVYRGHIIQTGDPVAIKVITAAFDSHDFASELFRREASALYQLQHEAIVRYFVISLEPVLGRVYMAMEFVEGESLGIIARRAALSTASVKLLARRLASGLQVAHAIGIVHRDIAPDNILVPGSDVRRAKIIDFGISRSSRNAGNTLFGSGFAGKENYASPEQVGLFGGEIGAKSDIYSLGLVLAEALQGYPLQMGGNMAEMVSKRMALPDLKAIDVSVRPLIEKMLQPDPDNRPESMQAVADWADTAIPATAPAKAAAPVQTVAAAALRPKRQAREVSWLLPAIIASLVAVTGGTWLALNPEILAKNPARPQTPPVLTTAPMLQPAAPENPIRPVPAAIPAVTEPLPVKEAAPAPVPPPVTQAIATPLAPAPLQSGPKFYPPSNSDLVPVMPIATVSDMARFVREFRGGDCFAAIPVTLSETAATIEGASLSLEQVDALTQSFKMTFHLDPDVGAWLITQNQCPVANFLAKAVLDPTLAPHIELASDKLRSGQLLSGTVEAQPGQTLEVLSISDDGEVQNITGKVRTAVSAASKRWFNLTVDRTGSPGEKPQLILAIASSQPVAALRNAKAMRADKLFPAVLAELALQGRTVGISLRMFNLD